MVSTAKIKHKKRYVQNEPKSLDSFSLPTVKINEDIGLVKRLGFFLEIKIYGDPFNPLEDSLRKKFEWQIKKLNIGDGRTTIKVSELKEMYSLEGVDFHNLKKRAKRTIKKRGEGNE